MAVKTITITEDAYHALSILKDKEESFSKAILRIAKKKSLRSFVGALSSRSADALERSIKIARKKRAVFRKNRMKRVITALEH